MKNVFVECNYCESLIHVDALVEYECVDDFMYHCPNCNNYVGKVPYPVEPEAPVTSDYDLTTDEIRYTLHILTKQLQKVDNARKQLHSTVTKLEIMLEVTKEKTNDR